MKALTDEQMYQAGINYYEGIEEFKKDECLIMSVEVEDNFIGFLKKLDENNYGFEDMLDSENIKFSCKTVEDCFFDATLQSKVFKFNSIEEAAEFLNKNYDIKN